MLPGILAETDILIFVFQKLGDLQSGPPARVLAVEPVHIFDDLSVEFLRYVRVADFFCLAEVGIMHHLIRLYVRDGSVVDYPDIDRPEVVFAFLLNADSKCCHVFYIFIVLYKFL